MDNKSNPEKTVPVITLGGQFWPLKVTHQVLERFSSIARCNLAEFDAVLQRYDMMVLLLWLMLAETRPDITRDKVRGWLQDLPVFDAVNLVTKSVADAVAYSFPETEQDKEPEEAPSDNPTEEDI